LKKASPCFTTVLTGLFLCCGMGAAFSGQNPQSAAVAKAVGDITQIQPGHITLHTDRGNVQVNLPDNVRVLRGSRDLKTATPITVGDLAVGDRAVVLGHLADDQQTIQAARIVVMTKAEISGIHEEEIREWQTRGIEGVVKSIDPDKMEVTIAVPNHPPTPGNLTHPVILTVTPKTALLRYAPNSVKFADAQVSNINALKVGDQLRALGTKSEDGSHFGAEKVVSGTFHNIGATVLSVDAQANILTVKNLSTNRQLIVHTDADTKMHQLPEFLAQMIARLSSGAPGGGGPGAGGAPAGGTQGGQPGGNLPRGEPGGPGGFNGGGGGMRRGGMGNLSQALENMPVVTLNDLKRGEPIVIFSSEGTNPSELTAIYILTGVEPILAAQPKGGGDVNLGSWNLSSGGGAAGGDAGP